MSPGTAVKFSTHLGTFLLLLPPCRHGHCSCRCPVGAEALSSHSIHPSPRCGGFWLPYAHPGNVQIQRFNPHSTNAMKNLPWARPWAWGNEENMAAVAAQTYFHTRIFAEFFFTQIYSILLLAHQRVTHGPRESPVLVLIPA